MVSNMDRIWLELANQSYALVSGSQNETARRSELIQDLGKLPETKTIVHFKR